MRVLLNNTSGTMYVANGRTLTVNVPLIEPAATPTGFTKSGTGTLTLAAANTFSGTVAVNAGSLILRNSSALGTGSLSLGASAAQVSIGLANLNINRPVTVNGGGGGTTGQGLIQFTPSTGSGTWSGNITVIGGPTLGGVFGSGGGELIVSGNVTSASGNVTVRTGNVTLSGAANSFPTLSIIEGTAKVGSSGALPSASRVEVGNGSAFIANLDTNGFSPSIRVLTSTSSEAANVFNNGASSSTLTLTGSTFKSIPNTVISRSGTSGSLTIGGGSGLLGLTFSTGTAVPVIVNDLGIDISAQITSTNGFTVSGTNTLTLSNAANSFPLLGITAGVVKLGAAGAIPASARVELGNSGTDLYPSFDTNGTSPTFRLLTSISATSSVSGTVFLGNDNAASASMLTLTGSTFNSIPNTVISRSGTGSLYIGGSASGAGILNLTFDTGAEIPVIDNSIGLVITSTITSANGFTKSGSGILALATNNASSLSALITGSAGTVAARASGALGSGTVAVSGALLQFDTNAGTYANPIVTTTTAEIRASNVQATLTGPITISGSTVFRGQGGNNNRFILSNANSITSTNDSSVAFNVDASQNHQVSGIISIGNGTVTKQSTATLTLSNASNSYGGLIQAGSGGITISANGAQGNGPITFASGGSGAITFSSVGGTIANDIVSTGGTGGIAKSGTGSTLTLTGNNTYTGATTVSGGYLRVANSNALSATSLVSLSASGVNPGGIQLDPGVVVNRPIQTAGRSDATTTGYILRGLGGSTGWQGTIEINSTGGNYAFVNDSGTMTLSGNLTSIATGAFGSRMVQFAGGGDIVMSGNIVKGGTLAVQDMSISKQGSGILTLSGTNDFSAGASLVGGTLRAGHVSAFGSGTVTVNGGTLDLAGLAIANPLAVTGGSVTNASAYAGTQTVSGAISYAGTVGGTLNVAAGGLLKGNNATFSGPVSITGTHSPGASPGLQTFTSGLGYTSAATLIWELSANTASAIDRGVLYDAIDMTTGGALSIDSSATISLVFNAPLADSTPSTVDWDDAFWGSPQQWKAIDILAPVTWNEVSFANVLVGNDITGASLATKRPGASFSVAAQGGDLYVVYVPEPGLLAAGMVGLGLVLAIRRRR